MVLSLCLPVGAVDKDTTPRFEKAARPHSGMTVPEGGSYFVTQGALTFEIANGNAFVAGCSPDAAGTVTIPDTVDGCPVIIILDYAFESCTGITRIKIPENVLAIGQGAFGGCTSLSQINLPRNLIYLDANALAYTSIFFDHYINGTVYLDGWLLYVSDDYSGALNVVPGTVGIASCAVAQCPNLTSVTVPDSVQYVCDYAFAEDPGLKEVVFQGNPPLVADVPELYVDIFDGDSLSVYYPEWNAAWDTASLTQLWGGSITWKKLISTGNVTIGDLTFEIKDGMAIVTGCSTDATGAVTIPDLVQGWPVTIIEDRAFQNCGKITSVKIPDTVFLIGDSSFRNCTSMAQVDLPASLTYINRDAFTNSQIFYNVYQDGVAYLDGWLLYVSPSYSGPLDILEYTYGVASCAVAQCPNLTSITVPASVQYICDYAFAQNSSLTQVTFCGNPPFAEEAPELYANIFWDDTLTICYPDYNDAWDTPYLTNLWNGNITWKVSPIFHDLEKYAWYYSYCMKAAELGLMSGVGNGRFDPDGTASRAMFVQILYSMAGKPEVSVRNPFADVPNNEWFTNAVLWAYENGITGGTSPTTFDPHQNVTREQLVLFLYSYCGKPEVTGDLSQYVDADTVDSWAVNAMIWATQKGLIAGYQEPGGTYLHPLFNATRAQTATIMTGFHDKLPELLPSATRSKHLASDVIL